MLIKTKTELRKYFKELRKGFDSEYRISADKDIATKLFSLPEFIDSKVILVYVSVDNEVETKLIIEKSIALGKAVAVPFCQNNKMDFHIINSFADLVCTQFGIPTVDPNTSEKIFDFRNTLCIVPALSFDKFGNRIGYGGGYYDKFLTDNNVNAVGICRDKQLSDTLPAEEYDVKIKTIVTENKIIKIQEV